MLDPHPMVAFEMACCTHVEVGHSGDGSRDRCQHSGTSHEGQQEVLQGGGDARLGHQGAGQGSAGGSDHAGLQRLRLLVLLGLLLAAGGEAISWGRGGVGEGGERERRGMYVRKMIPIAGATSISACTQT